MTGQEVLTLVLGIVAIVGIGFVVWWGGTVRGKRKPDGTIEFAAGGRPAPERIEIAKGAALEGVAKIRATGVAATDSAGIQAASGGISVGEKMIVKGGEEVELTGLDQRNRPSTRS
jgi:hypothetical protein